MVQKRRHLQESTSENNIPLPQAYSHWLSDNFENHDMSDIGNLFYGHVVEKINCPVCKFTKFSFSFTQEVLLDIRCLKDRLQREQGEAHDPSMPITLSDLLNVYFTEEIIFDYKCEKCKRKVNFVRQARLMKAPKVLLIILKRFELYPVERKDKSLVVLPECVDMREYLYDAQRAESCLYRLSGAVSQRGELSQGHYTA